MRKIVALAKRGPALSVEAFQQEWTAVHRGALAGRSGVARCVLNLPLSQGYRKKELAFDGVAEFWLGDSAADDLAGFSAIGAELLRPELARAWAVDVRVVKDGWDAAAVLKNIEFVNRRRDMTPESFHQYWWKVHGPIAAGIPQVVRYEQNQLAADSYVAGEPRFDGLAVTWFRSTAEMREAVNTAAFRDAALDEPNFLSGDPVEFVIVRETVIKG